MDQIQGSQVSTPVDSVTHLTQGGENEFGFAAAKPKAPRQIWLAVFNPMRRRRLGSFSFCFAEEPCLSGRKR